MDYSFYTPVSNPRGKDTRGIGETARRTMKSTMKKKVRYPYFEMNDQERAYRDKEFGTHGRRSCSFGKMM